MDVTLLYFDGCPSWLTTAGHLATVAGEVSDVVITHQLIETPEDAERWGFRGSPSVLIDGIDPFGAVDAPVGLTCRLYQTADGPAGSPTLDQLRAALRDGSPST